MTRIPITPGASVVLTCIVLAVSLLTPRRSLALTLTSPKDGIVVRSGQVIPVGVLGDETANLRTVRYFWFRIGEESVSTYQAVPARFVAVDGKRPFDGTVQVPPDALGLMRLLAVGEVVRGRLAGQQDFDEVVLKVEPEAELTAIDFAVEQPWRLHVVGRRLPIPVLGQFKDGVVRPLGGQETGSIFRSSDERVVQVDQQGDLLVVGRGRASISLVNRQKEGRIDVIVDGDEEPNRPPVAVASSHVTVRPGSVVLLDGRQSRDPDGDPLHFEWRQTRGNKVDLTTPNEASTTFLAPRLSARRLLQFQLMVTDLKGPDTVKGADSVPAVVDVWVEP
jgi:hypothetical protein